MTLLSCLRIAFVTFIASSSDLKNPKDLVREAFVFAYFLRLIWLQFRISHLYIDIFTDNDNDMRVRELGKL